VKRLFIGGLATDYCVLNTVKDARRLGYEVVLLMDAVRAVNVRPDDGANAEAEMLRLGALPARYEELTA
jgi:nicotinamidase/pyrazinamidase